MQSTGAPWSATVTSFMNLPSKHQQLSDQFSLYQILVCMLAVALAVLVISLAWVGAGLDKHTADWE
jgi:hypothetical protein